MAGIVRGRGHNPSTTCTGTGNVTERTRRDIYKRRNYMVLKIWNRMAKGGG